MVGDNRKRGPVQVAEVVDPPLHSEGLLFYDAPVDFVGPELTGGKTDWLSDVFRLSSNRRDD